MWKGWQEGEKGNVLVFSRSPALLSQQLALSLDKCLLLPAHPSACLCKLTPQAASSYMTPGIALLTLLTTK